MTAEERQQIFEELRRRHGAASERRVSLEDLKQTIEERPTTMHELVYGSAE